MTHGLKLQVLRQGDWQATPKKGSTAGTQYVMELQALNCNNCGAQLRVSETAKFVTCAHCDAQLAIHRNESSAYTEQIAELKETTSEIAEHVAQLAYDSKLDRIDEEWEDERAGFMTHDKQGQEVPPAVQVLLSGIGVALGIGMSFWFPWPATMAPLALVVAAGIGLVSGIYKARNYGRAYERYLNRRRKVKLADFLPRSRRNKA